MQHDTILSPSKAEYMHAIIFPCSVRLAGLRCRHNKLPREQLEYVT